MSAAFPRVSVVIPVYNEEAGLPALFDRLYPALDAIGQPYEVIFVNDGSRDRSAAMLREQFARRPDVTRVVLLNGNFGQHLAIIAGFEHCRADRVVTLDADLQNPPEEIVHLLREMDRGSRLRRRRPAHARGLVVPADRLEGDEPTARAHHPRADHRPGLHAARLQPQHRPRHRQFARGEHVHPGAGVHLRHESHRGRGRARRARGRRVQVLALPAHPAQLRPDHGILAGAAADVLDVRDAGRGRIARDLPGRHRRAPAAVGLARGRVRRCGTATSSSSS